MKELLIIIALFFCTVPHTIAQRVAEEHVYQFSAVQKPPVYEEKDPLASRYIMNYVSTVQLTGDTSQLPTRLTYMFVVEADGSISNKRITKGNSFYDKYFLEALNRMHIWQPGINNGKKVAVEMILPIVCILWE